MTSRELWASGTLALQHPSDEGNILDQAQRGSDSNSGETATYQNIKSKDTLKYQTEHTQIFYHLFVMYLFYTQSQ